MSTAWLYQMSAQQWPEAHYREGVWEGMAINWPTNRVSGSARPQPGDRMFCWYVRTGAQAPGLCGWGIVTNHFAQLEQVVWRPVFPSDYLKMQPLFSQALDARISNIRGGFRQGTMWPIDRSDADWLAARVRELIH